MSALDDVIAQKAVVDAAYTSWQSALATYTNLKQVLKQWMVTQGIQEGSQNDPRPLSIRSEPTRP